MRTRSRRSSSCSAWRRDGSRVARRTRRSLARTSAEPSTSDAPLRLSEADPSAVLGTSSTPRAPVRAGGSCLVREAATDDGAPRQASPFWDEAREPVRPRRRRSLDTDAPATALTWPLEQAPTERERLRALAALSGSRAGRRRCARRGGSSRGDERASAFRRPTKLTNRSARGALPSDRLRRDRARSLRDVLVHLVRRALRLATLDRCPGRCKAARLARPPRPCDSSPGFRRRWEPNVSSPRGWRNHSVF